MIRLEIITTSCAVFRCSGDQRRHAHSDLLARSIVQDNMRMNVMRSGQTPARATRVCTMTPGSSKVISDRWRRRISGRISLQLVKEYGQRIAGWAIAPHDFERRPDRSRVVERSDEHVGDIGPGDPVVNGQRQRALRHHDSTLAPWAVEQNPGSDDGVLEPTAANLVL